MGVCLEVCKQLDKCQKYLILLDKWEILVIVLIIVDKIIKFNQWINIMIVLVKKLIDNNNIII